MVVRVFVEPVIDKICADKAGTTRNKEIFQLRCSL